MKLISFSRIIRFGLKNFWRNGWLSAATTLIMVLTLFFVSSLIILNILLNSTLLSVKEKIDLSVYFKAKVSEKEISALKSELEIMREIKLIEVITKEEAIKRFSERHKSDPLITSLLAELEENPFPASMVIKAKNPEDYSVISDRLKIDRYKELIDKATYEDNKIVIQKITKISDAVTRAGFIIGFVFSIAAILFMFNTIRMTIFTQGEEIKIMRLVGATRWFIRQPYLIEAIMYGFFASVVNMIILYFVLQYLSPRFSQFIGSDSADLFSYFSFHIFRIFLYQFLFSAVLGIISSRIATRKYLRV